MRCFNSINVAAFALALIVATNTQAEPALQLDAGVWTDNHPQGETDTRTPISVELDDRGRLAETDLRYGVLARAADHDFFQDENTLAVREAFLQIEAETDDLKIGRLLLPWGRADQINPTDSLVTRDYQWRTTSDEQQKSGNDGFAWTHSIAEWQIVSVWLPHLESSRLPWIKELEQIDRPSIDDHRNLALRLDKTGEGFDAGFSVYQGADLMPSLRVDTGPTVTMNWENYRIRRIGFDGAVNLGRSTLRTEIAKTTVLTDRTDSSAQLYGVPADEWQMVVGVDRDVADGLNINVQLLGQWLEHETAASTLPKPLKSIVDMQQLLNQQPEKNLYGVTWRVHQNLWQDTLALEVSGVAYGDHQGGIWRPRVNYKLDDKNTLIVGGDRFYGDNGSEFGLLTPDNVWFVNWQYSL